MYYKLLFLLLFSLSAIAQQSSIHEEQLKHYNSMGNASSSYYEDIISASNMSRSVNSNCNLNKVVYGWHPYWVGNVHENYQWELLSHFSYFCYEVDPNDGEPITTHGWSTSAAVDSALASGNTKVTLTATLFSDHSTFFSTTSNQQTLIDNLINLVQSRGAHGVNIDFEGMPSSYRIDFAYFMVNLANQMHAAIPGSEVSTVLYAVDWNDVFDFSLMEPAVDHYIIMGYAYYYQGSSNSGPCDPLYHFGNTYNYTLSKSITDYLHKGCPKEKLIMGLPYYGYQWPTSSLTVPSPTTGSGTAKTYKQVKNNSSGNYTTANYQYDQDSYTDIYVFDDGGPQQCFITLEDGFRKRLEHINTTEIGGIGIWALGYDDGYNDLWNGINDYLTDCYEQPCSGTIHDFGGPYRNYYDDEDYVWTIEPPNVDNISLNFTDFDIEVNYDYLYIYDGNDTTANQFPGSPFTGTNSPGSLVSSGNAITLYFYSDMATTSPGFVANYSCTPTGSNDILINSSIKLYPIPVSNTLTVSLNDFTQNSGNIKIFNSIGKVVYNKATGLVKEIKIDVSSWSYGVYHIYLNTNSNSEAASFIKPQD